jgi:hypothetical protein
MPPEFVNTNPFPPTVKERPILFSAPMVRALLDGSKTQTRRVGGLEVINAEPNRYEFRGITSGPGAPHFAFHDRESGAQVLVRCRHGQPGDRLWVRETFGNLEGDGVPPEWSYRADTHDAVLPPRWTPSIHMPRAASRIDLEVTGVRVERLLDISESDAIAEGVEPLTEPGAVFRPAASAYSDLWEQINGAGSWAANPWVWVVEFQKIKSREEASR